MATDTAVHEDLHTEQGGEWDGGKAPFKASYGKLMMWYFLLSDAFTFAGFLIAYGTTRFMMPSWPVPDFVFSTAPLGIHEWFPGDKAPLIFVTFMSFLLIVSSVTMVRGVQEGHRENKRGVIFWMLLTVIGGFGFLSCQAWEWNNLINEEHMSVTRNPFGTHLENGTYLHDDGSESTELVEAGKSYLVHMAGHGHHGDHDEGHAAHADNFEIPAVIPEEGIDRPGYFLDKEGFKHRKYKLTSGPDAGSIAVEEFGPKGFGALFFFITGFHGFHVLSGVVFLLIILINVASGVYVKRKNGYEMVEKIGLYWHFVDLVWVFVFLVFYLI
ncbi:MAG: cytochrome c oxidase subunit 3 [Saprospiraceae bacterium]